jgi:hypothetical protein
LKLADGFVKGISMTAQATRLPFRAPPNMKPTGPAVRRILIENRNGSVEHYFHFLLGFCAPLVNYGQEATDNAPTAPWLIRECGPLTSLLRELPLNLRILPKLEHARFPAAVSDMRLYGYDAPKYYSYPAFCQFRAGVASLAPSRPKTRRKNSILLVEREPSHPFYLSAVAESKSSGSARRAIRNHAEVAAALASAYPDAQSVRLAGLSLTEQFALFDSAELVVAQHGAALGNLIFMREGSKVIEIGNRRWPRSPFKKLAKIMRLHYALIDIDSAFPVVQPTELLAMVAALLAKHPPAADPGRAKTSS